MITMKEENEEQKDGKEGERISRECVRGRRKREWVGERGKKL